MIHGGIDGFSRLVVFLKAATNNRASTVLDCFRDAVNQYNLHSRVRTDLRLENTEVARFMLQSRGAESSQCYNWHISSQPTNREALARSQ